jgi:hypothetical protein
MYGYDPGGAPMKAAKRIVMILGLSYCVIGILSIIAPAAFEFSIYPLYLFIGIYFILEFIDSTKESSRKSDLILGGGFLLLGTAGLSLSFLF